MYKTKRQNIPIAEMAWEIGLKKIIVNEVKKAIAENGVWKGYIVGNNVNPYHVKNFTHLGCWIEVNTLEELEKYQNSFMFYLEPELGNGIHYYEDVSRKD